ncbi:cytoplasmic dynein 2 light intermediate chain 1-like isoform X2 [Liolophura sinensis]|uniref:cytoplasmic dynein 2 light intermediate chain 1-like isoform X2 n=1 Tax=Liolophura sinensis TaxID=3198878 RepID=UPI0031597EB3
MKKKEKVQDQKIRLWLLWEVRMLDEAPKPTVALEYTFGRRSKGHNIAKDVGHIWELGGGTWLTKLMDIPLNADNLLHTTLVIMLDLSKPNELWFTLESLLKAAKARIDAVIQEMKSTKPDIKDVLKQKCWHKLGADNPDKSLMDPFLIPLVIVGGKYDMFQEFESEKRKVICKALRFMAHTHGASLQCFSVKQEQLVTRSRALISHHLFGTSASKTLQTDHNKPLLVPAGQDSLQLIGTPPLADGDIGKISARSPVELWKHAYTSYFPQENINNPAIVEDPAKDPHYAEAAIDTLRAQKDEELMRYQALCERRNRETQQGYTTAY